MEAPRQAFTDSLGAAGNDGDFISELHAGYHTNQGR
jgi:hypothetical protein